MAVKPATPSGVMGYSAPPAIMMIGFAALDDADGIADGVGAGGAGGAVGQVGAL